MEVQTFITDTDYYKTFTHKQKYTFLKELFRSLKSEECKCFKVIDGIEHTLDGYKIPFRRAEFSDIHEFERIVKNSYIVFDTEENYQSIIDLIEKAKRNENNGIYYHFEIRVDPVRMRYLEEDDILRFEFSYNKPKVPEIGINITCKGL